MRAVETARNFGVEMSAQNFIVVGNFRENVREGIRCAYLRAIIKLRADRSERRGERDVAADVLIRIFDPYSERPVIVRVIGDSKLSGASVRNADAEVLIFVVGDGQVGRHRADTITIRG